MHLTSKGLGLISGSLLSTASQQWRGDDPIIGLLLPTEDTWIELSSPFLATVQLQLLWAIGKSAHRQKSSLFVSQKNQKVHWTYTLFWNSILWWIFESPTYYSLNMYYVPALAECYLKYFQYYFKYFQVSHCYNWDTREKLCFIWAHGFEVHSSWLGNLNGLACDNSSGWWDVYSGRITGQARVCKARAARLAQDYITNPLVRTTFWGMPSLAPPSMFTAKHHNWFSPSPSNTSLGPSLSCMGFCMTLKLTSNQ